MVFLGARRERAGLAMKIMECWAAPGRPATTAGVKSPDVIRRHPLHVAGDRHGQGSHDDQAGHNDPKTRKRLRVDRASALSCARCALSVAEASAAAVAAIRLPAGRTNTMPSRNATMRPRRQTQTCDPWGC